MKIMQPALFILLALTLSGCAYNGYQHGYVGYSSDYGSGYSTGYAVQESYDYPVQTYYPQGGGVIRYQQRHVDSHYPNRAALHGGDGHHGKKWHIPKTTHGHQPSGVWDSNAEDHSYRRHAHQQNPARASSRQDAAVPKRAWRSMSASTQMRASDMTGRGLRDSDNRTHGISDRYAHGRQ